MGPAWWAALLALAAAAPAVGQRPPRPSHPPDVSTYLDVRYPSAIAWSPDGRRIAFELTNARGSEIRVVTLPAGPTVTAVRDIPRRRYVKDRADLRWRRDGIGLLYRAGTQYFSVPAGGGTPEPLLTDTLPRELVQLSQDQGMLSFLRDGDLWVQPVGGAPRRLTDGQKFLAYDGELFGRLFQWPQLSPDGTAIAFVSAATAEGAKVGVVRVADGTVRWLAQPDGVWNSSIVEWSPDGQRLAVSRLSRDFRRKQLVVSDLTGDRSITVREDSDPKWVSHNIDPGFAVSWARDGRRLAFLSNGDGWRHLYVAGIDGTPARQVTRGKYEVSRALWSPTGDRILAFSSRTQLQELRPWSIEPDGGEDGGTTVPLLSEPGSAEDSWWPGYLTGPAWSPDGSRVAFGYTGPEDPYQLRVAPALGGSPPAILYSALSDGLPREAVARMQAVTVRGADGTGNEVPALLLTPRRLDSGRKHPALIYHYGGWGQMARMGWALTGVKSRLFQYLVSKGYVVLLADPRGSDGYGQDYAHGLYLEGGGKQAEDLAAAASYLSRLAYVDPKAIAIFGHSYGAYLALTTMLRFPDRFAAGVLQAGVFDWRAYGADNTYLDIRFGKLSVEPKVPDLQVRPAAHLDRLHAPLLLLHGTTDFNAPYSNSERLVNGLLRAGGQFDFMTYPGERHDWEHFETDRDFILRVERFLDMHLR